MEYINYSNGGWLKPVKVSAKGDLFLSSCEYDLGLIVVGAETEKCPSWAVYGRLSTCDFAGNQRRQRSSLNEGMFPMQSRDSTVPFSNKKKAQITR